MHKNSSIIATTALCNNISASFKILVHYAAKNLIKLVKIFEKNINYLISIHKKMYMGI